jgi:hypothetical protein
MQGLLGWDELVQLPVSAAECRAAQKAALAGVIYERQTDKEVCMLSLCGTMPLSQRFAGRLRKHIAPCRTAVPSTQH